jgi:TM2 domain-containing membrane protein YozV
MTANESPKPVTAYCRTCGKPLTEDTVCVAQGTVFCAEHAPQAAPAGAPASPYAAPAAHLASPGVSPGLAFLLGLIPGVGAIYNGQYAKGLIHVVIFGMIISILSSGAANGLEPVFGMLLGVFYFYMAFEAYHTARRRMLGEPVEEFSSLVQTRSSSMPVLPLVLIGLGVLFLLNNFGLIQMYYVMKFWPVLLIGGGVYLLWLRLKPAAPEAPPTETGPAEGSDDQR